VLRGALLVAPADPLRVGVALDLWRGRPVFPTTVVASTNDPWLKLVKAGHLAAAWGARLIVYRDAGHINAESGYGPWPDGLRLIAELDRAGAGGGSAAPPRAPVAD